MRFVSFLQCSVAEPKPQGAKTFDGSWSLNEDLAQAPAPGQTKIVN